MLNLGCGQYLRNPFFPGFWGQKWGCGLCILADYTRLYTVYDVFSQEKAPGQNWEKMIDLTSKWGEINSIEHNKGRNYPQN